VEERRLSYYAHPLFKEEEIDRSSSGGLRMIVILSG